jgi:phage terminase small subunit
MLDVLNDTNIDDARRDRMAIAAAPFVHGRAGEMGKRDHEAEAARRGVSGKFATPPAPRLVIDNR